jgi:hypothetical protein
MDRRPPSHLINTFAQDGQPPPPSADGAKIACCRRQRQGLDDHIFRARLLLASWISAPLNITCDQFAQAQQKSQPSDGVFRSTWQCRQSRCATNKGYPLQSPPTAVNIALCEPPKHPRFSSSTRCTPNCRILMFGTSTCACVSINDCISIGSVLCRDARVMCARFRRKLSA